MIPVSDILYEITENRAVYDANTDLIESGILDSYTLIELFAALEDHGVFLQPTRIDRALLRTVRGIEELIDKYQNQTF